MITAFKTEHHQSARATNLAPRRHVRIIQNNAGPRNAASFQHRCLHNKSLPNIGPHEQNNRANTRFAQRASHNATVDSGTGALKVLLTTKSLFQEDDTECFHCHQLLHRGEIHCYDVACCKCGRVDTAHHGGGVCSSTSRTHFVHFGSQRGRRVEVLRKRSWGTVTIYAEVGRECAVRVHSWFA